MIKKYDDRDVSWIKVSVHNTDGSQVAEFTPLEDSDDESDEAQLSRLYEQLESAIGNQIMPGAKDDFLVMLESGG